MKNPFDNYGFLSCGFKNILLHEPFELIRKGAFIVDVREEYINKFNPKIISL